MMTTNKARPIADRGALGRIVAIGVLLVMAAPADAAMITGATDGAKAATARQFHNWKRYDMYAYALPPEQKSADSAERKLTDRAETSESRPKDR
jgi:hypothetical protein